MKRALLPSLFVVLAALSTAAGAAPKTVTLSVPGMTCSTCPIQVKKALSRVSGVLKASASLEAKEAVVTYEDSKTSVEALMKATADIGFPSTLKK